MGMVDHGESGVLRGTCPIPNPGRRIRRTRGLEREFQERKEPKTRHSHHGPPGISTRVAIFLRNAEMIFGECLVLPL
jgi:hypothetical protein